MAAGAQITQSRFEEVVTKNNKAVLYEAGHWNGYNLNPLTSINERASLVPAAAVIPALKVHRTIAAVKKLVVGSVPVTWFTRKGDTALTGFGPVFAVGSLYWLLPVAGWFTLSKSECSAQASCRNVRAWNNRKGFRSSFVGFVD
jgi:hypothetical protein